MLYSAAVKLLLWIAPTIVFVSWVRGEPPAGYLGVRFWPEGRKWLTSLLVSVTFLAIVAGLELNLADKRFVCFHPQPRPYRDNWLSSSLVPQV